MALYLIVHNPDPALEDAARPPSRLAELARDAVDETASPRWLRAWSPDVLDDRIFSLWEAENAEEIRGAMERYGFLDHMRAEPFRVREWGPADVLAAES